MQNPVGLKYTRLELQERDELELRVSELEEEANVLKFLLEFQNLISYSIHENLSILCLNLYKFPV
jgi:hypothetical protein